MFFRLQTYSTLPNSLGSYHLTEIMATVVNEYTNWDRPGFHPITTRDETVALLSDALYAAPVVHIGALHSSVSSRSYFYVYDHHTKNNDYDNPSLEVRYCLLTSINIHI